MKLPFFYSESFVDIDRAIHEVSGSKSWTPVIVDGPRVVVDQTLFIAEGVNDIMPSNNNVAAILYNKDVLYLAWRSSPTHFASKR